MKLPDTHNTHTHNYTCTRHYFSAYVQCLQPAAWLLRHRIAAHTNTTLQLPRHLHSVSVFVRLRCMDDILSWLVGWASQWRPPQARCMHCRIVRQFGRRWRLALCLKLLFFNFLAVLRDPMKFYPSVAFCEWCEVGGKWCQHDSQELK